jgi:hypothetical protein
VTEDSHDDLRYSGEEDETVTVSVEAIQTVQMVTYTVKGITKPLPAGEDIEFQLEKGTNVLQLVMDATALGSSYRVIVQTVDNETDNECVHVWTYRGNLMIKDYRFFV